MVPVVRRPVGRTARSLGRRVGRAPAIVGRVARDREARAHVAQHRGAKAVEHVALGAREAKRVPRRVERLEKKRQRLVNI